MSHSVLVTNGPSVPPPFRGSLLNGDTDDLESASNNRFANLTKHSVPELINNGDDDKEKNAKTASKNNGTDNAGRKGDDNSIRMNNDNTLQIIIK